MHPAGAPSSTSPAPSTRSRLRTRAATSSATTRAWSRPATRSDRSSSRRRAARRTTRATCSTRRSLRRAAGWGGRLRPASPPDVKIARMSLVLVERNAPIAVVLLNRPQQPNALSDSLMDELVSTLQELDDDDEIRCIVLGRTDRAFAAGADIGELAQSSAIDLYYARRIERWDAIRNLWTPLVAAVSGYCLGGGCELAMSCDLIVASETARFGQPETGLGIIPGAGGTQRLTRAVGKALAMDVILSGRQLDAREALAAGLVARVVAKEAWLEEAKRVAREVAAKGPVATRLAEEAVDRAHETTLGLGLEYERRALDLAFASEDAKEGLTAFTEKRKPDFKGR